MSETRMFCFGASLFFKLLVSNLLLMMLVTCHVEADIVEDFEGEVVGTFPSAWQDVGQVDNSFPVPNPSAIVIETTDAFGNQTQALSLVDYMGAPQGIYQTIGTHRSVKISADVRIDQQAAQWPMDFAYVKNDGTQFGAARQMGLYMDSTTQNWASWSFGTNGTFQDTNYGVPFALGDWYRVTVDLDSVAGTLHSRVTELATGTLILDEFEAIVGWSAADGQFDTIAFFDSDFAGDFANLAVIDNIMVTTIPESTSGSLAAIALIGFVFRRRRQI